MAKKSRRKSRRKRPSPLTRLIQDGPRTDAQAIVFAIVISERTALEKRISLARAATGEKMRVDRAPRHPR